MSEEKKEIWWKTPPYAGIVSGLAVAAILGLVRLLYVWIIEGTTVTDITALGKLIGNSFLYVLNFQFRFWWLLLASFIVLTYLNTLRIYKISKALENPPKNQVHSTEIAKMLSDNAEKFDGVIWVWEWRYNSHLRRYEAKDAAPLCTEKTCFDVKMIQDYFNDEFMVYNFKCPKCGNSYGSVDTEKSIGEWAEQKYQYINQPS